MRREVTSSTAALRRYGTDLSSIVGTLVGGTTVEQINSARGWVHVRMDDGREGWLPEDELGPLVGDAETLIDTQRDVLQTELAGVETVQLGTLVDQLEKIAESKDVQAAVGPTGWQFATETAKAVIGKNYTFHAFIALFLYTFLWIPGLLANIIFLGEANRQKAQTSNEPQGKGCLVWLLWVFGILPVVIFVLLLIIGLTVAEDNGG